MAIRPFEPYVVVLVDYGTSCQFWTEVPAGEKIEETIRLMTTRELDGVQRVIRVHPDKAPEDLNQEVADALIKHDNLPEDALDFCAAFGSPNTKSAARCELEDRREATK